MLSVQMIEDRLAAGMTPAEIDLGSWRRNLRVIRSQKIEKYSDLNLILETNNMHNCALCYVNDCEDCTLKKLTKRNCRNKRSEWNYMLKAKNNADLIDRVEDLIILLEACTEKEKKEFTLSDIS